MRKSHAWNPTPRVASFHWHGSVSKWEHHLGIGLKGDVQHESRFCTQKASFLGWLQREDPKETTFLWGTPSNAKQSLGDLRAVNCCELILAKGSPLPDDLRPDDSMEAPERTPLRLGSIYGGLGASMLVRGSVAQDFHHVRSLSDCHQKPACQPSRDAPFPTITEVDRAFQDDGPRKPSCPCL